MNKPKKIILIVIDSLRADHLGCYGYKRNTSPTIDKIANENILFKWAFSTISYTVPSFTSILTSLYPSNHSIGFHQKFPKFDKDKDIILSEILKSSNYSTAAFISSMVLRKEIGLDSGFDIYDAPDGRNAEDVNEKFFGWLDDNYKKDFFTMIHYFDVHLPYRPPSPYDKEFIEDKYYRNPKYLDVVPDGWGGEGEVPQIGGIPKSSILLNNDLVEKDSRYYISQYDGSIKYVDNAIAAIIEKLKELNIYEECLLIVTADHGEAMGENNVWFYHSLSVTPDQIHVPLVIKFPRDHSLNPRRVITHVSLIDLMPTILDMVGFEYDNLSLQGKSLMKLIEEGYDDAIENRILNAEIEGQIANIDGKTIYVKPKKIDKHNLVFFYVEELCSKEMAFDYRKNNNTLEVTGERYLPWMDDAIINFEHLHRYAFASQFIEGKKVLDLASGEGYGSNIISKKANYVVGIDIDENAVEHARITYTAQNLKFIQGSILNIPIQNNEKFDVIICFEAIEHVEDHEKLLSEVKRLLKWDGLFIVSSPNKKSYSDEPGFINLFHKKELYFNDFRNLLEKNFKVSIFFGQKVYSASNIWPLTSKPSSSHKEFALEKKEGKFCFSDVDTKIPLYFIAIASDKILNQGSDTASNLIDVSEIIIGNLEEQITTFTNVIRNNNEKIIEQNEVLRARNEQIKKLELSINSIHQSITWKFLVKYQKFVEVMLPPATKRRRAYDKGILYLRLIANEGLSNFLIKIREKVHRSVINASAIPIIETNIIPPYDPISLKKSLDGKFTFPLNNLNKIGILTTTYPRKNSDLEIQIANEKGQILRKARVKDYQIKNDGYTLFRFKSIKDSKDKTYFFKIISRDPSSVAVWHSESITFPEVTLFDHNELIKGCIGFQAYADIGIKSKYDLWIQKNEPTALKLEQYKNEIKSFIYKPKISIVIPVYNPDVAWIRAAIESVKNQIYENWELCLADASTKQDVIKCIEKFANKDARIKVKFLKKNEGISGNSNEALSLATGEFIALLDHDDKIASFALYEVVKLLNQKPYLDFIYSDEDKLDKNDKRCDAFFKPDWSPDLLFSCMYTCHFSVYRKKIIDKIGGFRLGYDGSQDYDLVLRFIEFTDSNKIAHIPKILYHWRKVPGSIASDPIAKNCVNIISAKTALNDALMRLNIKGKVEDGKWLSSYRIRRNIFGNPKVSIIIPTRDKAKILKNCIDSIKQKTTYGNYELIVVDNNSIEPETIEYLNNLDCIKIKCKENFNFSKINNLAVNHAKGDYIVFLNNDIEIITRDWIQSMLEHAQRNEVGAVGCKLLFPDRTIQHAGVVLGLSPDPRNTVAGHIFIKSNNVDHGYFGLIDTTRNCSAVTAAAMMIRKDVFNKVGGFDENIAVSYNDVDLCLKIREKGYLIVYTPFVELIHHESASRGNNLDLTEVRYMMDKWGNTLKFDPYYNPNLSLNKVNCEVNV